MVSKQWLPGLNGSDSFRRFSYGAFKCVLRAEYNNMLNVNCVPKNREMHLTLRGSEPSSAIVGLGSTSKHCHVGHSHTCLAIEKGTSNQKIITDTL